MTKQVALTPEAEVRTPPPAIQIADQLERDIIAGRYRPGERLREIESRSEPASAAARAAKPSGSSNRTEATAWIISLPTGDR